MVYCPHCDDYCNSIEDPDRGYMSLMGFTLMSLLLLRILTQGRCLAENILPSIRERTLMKGREQIRQIVSNLHVGGGDTIINKAHRFYTLAVDHNFTRGHQKTHVAAACLYIACRLSADNYVLGAVFLQLCQVLLLSDDPVVQKLIDPSLFIHRFTERLLGRQDNNVSATALRIVASMKRDWMQTGRKPSGLCGAALYLAALAHGYDYTKADIVAVVHMCEATLTKRLIEFENTGSGSLTIEEFFKKADEFSQELVSKPAPKFGILCKHKDKSVEHFAHGLCEKVLQQISGRLEGVADRLALQLADKQRLEGTKMAEQAVAIKEAVLGESIYDTHNSIVENATSTPRKDLTGDKSSTLKSAEVIIDSLLSKGSEGGGENSNGDPDSESLSDIDDVEVRLYLHDEEEKQYKKVIWEEMNKEYLKKQAAKEALAADLVARDVGVEEGNKKKQRLHEDAKNSIPAETPAEVTYNMLKRKRLGVMVGRVYERRRRG
ncbi:hypothetical protein ACP70R_035136 [Stipagrostis hirtigluma subsp. patula]